MQRKEFHVLQCTSYVKKDSSSSNHHLTFLDLAMQLNQGKFEYNGSCGYVNFRLLLTSNTQFIAVFKENYLGMNQINHFFAIFI